MQLLTLSPLVAILLLAFFWFILLTLLLWFAFRPRRNPETQRRLRNTAHKTGRSTGRRDRPREDLPAEDPLENGVPSRSVRPQVRVVHEPQAEQPPSKRQDDAFDEFAKPSNRRDEFDF